MAHPVEEETHLGMSALLAGVASKGVWQSDYLLECLQDAVIRRVAAQ